MNLHMGKKWHKSIHICFNNISFLALLLYYSYVRYNCWGNCIIDTSNLSLLSQQFPMNL